MKASLKNEDITGIFVTYRSIVLGGHFPKINVCLTRVVRKILSVIIDITYHIAVI